MRVRAWDRAPEARVRALRCLCGIVGRPLTVAAALHARPPPTNHHAHADCARRHPPRAAQPAVPFAGLFRLIDVPVSNCLHSGINNIYVLTQ
jgi:hypothetical protein